MGWNSRKNRLFTPPTDPTNRPAGTAAGTDDDVIASAARVSAERARGMLAQGSGLLPVKLHPKQQAFVDDDRLEILYGGAAGSGKSCSLLAAALKYIHVPNHSALLIRRSYSHLTMAGGLIPMAREWLTGKATYNASTFTWGFPNGSKLAFGYLDGERDLDKYQGAEFQFVGFDEATQFPEHHYRYLFSRLRRSTLVDVPLRMRAASNPGGIGHDWVKRRFLVEGEQNGRRFIPASLVDNPSLDREMYERSLAELDPLTRQRLLAGDWDAVPEGGMFKRDWFQIVEPYQVPDELRPVRYWDRASTVPRPNTDPDWTVGVLAGCHRGVWYLVDIQRFRGSSSENERRIRRTAEADGRRVPIWMEQEPGSSGKDVIDHYARNVLPGYTFKSNRPTGNKQDRAAPVGAAAEQGNLKLVNGRWVSDFLDEAGAFPMGGHDDQIDALSGVFAVLTTRHVVRSLKVSWL